MAIVAGFDVHKAQITFDALDLESGEIHRGRIPSTREAVRKWVKRFDDKQIDVAVEAGTGWLFVCEELAGAGATAHLAEPAETRALRGPSAAPRPTARTPAGCGRCSARAGFPSPGSRRPISGSCAPAPGCERP